MIVSVMVNSIGMLMLDNQESHTDLESTGLYEEIAIEQIKLLRLGVAICLSGVAKVSILTQYDGQTRSVQRKGRTWQLDWGGF